MRLAFGKLAGGQMGSVGAWNAFSPDLPAAAFCADCEGQAGDFSSLMESEQVAA
jgi:hypothetical protein